jgi:3',5'-cyclic AMP phosphodiesterase CpdA
MTNRSLIRRRVLVVAFALISGGGAAQEFSARLPEIHSAPTASMCVGVLPTSASPASELAPALAAPSALPAASLGAASPDSVAKAAPEARSAALPAAARPANTPAKNDRAISAPNWDGANSAQEDSAVVPESEAVRRLAEPFRTRTQLAKLAGTERPAGSTLRFAVIGDAEPGRFWIWRKLFNRDPAAFWKLLKRADASDSDFIVQLGDMVSRGVLRNFRAFFLRLRAAAPRTPYLTVIGNHDRERPHGLTNSRLYRSLFGRTNYAFERGGRLFVVVDNSGGRITPGQFKWLREVLSADEPAVVFTHMPPAPLGEWTNFGRKGSGGFRKGADEFMRLMSERKVARVYVGHVHGLGVLERGGVRYILTGGGGSPLYPGPVKDKFFHYLTVEDGPDGLVETVHPARGEPFVLR